MGSLVCGLEADGLSGWVGGMTTTSGCVDVVSCGGPVSESGGGGGGGDGVGEWSRVIGLGEVWLSGGLLSRGCEFRLGYPSIGAVVGRSAWGMGSVGAIMEVRCPITLPSLFGFLVKFDVMVATIRGCVPFPVNIGAWVEIF